MFKSLKVAALVGFAVLSCNASATVLFSENFNAFSGIQSGTQEITGFNLAYSAGLAQWTTTGENAIHLVDYSGAGNWAAMFYDSSSQVDDNKIVSQQIASGNTLGQLYNVNFDVSGAVYSSFSQANNASDGVVVTVRNSLGAVIQSQTYLPGAFETLAAPGSLAFSSASLNYTGTGTGNGAVQLEFTANNAGAQRFGGAIDNVVLDSVAVPEPRSLLLLLVGLAALAAASKRRGSR